MIRAVLFDIGGPVDLETAFEAAIDVDIRTGLACEGIVVDDDAWRQANDLAVSSFAPSLYRAVIWRLTNGNGAASQRIYEWMEERAHSRDLFELRQGIPDVLKALRRRGLKLGLVANQPVTTLERLAREGIGHYFENEGISPVYGFRKPDVRIFLRACDDLRVGPAECVMVGDRIDNDIVPAKLLGMRTVRVRTGRHINQEPRSWDETPDADVYDASGILETIEAMVEPPSA
jgi:HAD superfamily hydrolase (TIGR01549 family)